MTTNILAKHLKQNNTRGVNKMIRKILNYLNSERPRSFKISKVQTDEYIEAYEAQCINTGQRIYFVDEDSALNWARHLVDSQPRFNENSQNRIYTH